ncbi:FXSXX-COOH protein [Streptomyces zhaozhouensis]|uniref:FXSXX-COOH protein n=1 Tax=Streptomyces zhaozhouensis TaxID=1300267 RepID=A0A286DQ67_9ACTN|nr:FXSXX-COOH protein [Streptomyces zhaozhouensis]SOD60781.1 FXSXX-COOH protein [Streptomyces zhaozhouensis]
MATGAREAVASGGLPELPDLLALSLAEVRRMDHPVLESLLAELRERLAHPRETLWDFDEAPKRQDW